MLSIISTPPKVSFSGNPIRYRVETTDYMYSVGVKANMELEITGIDKTEAHSFVLTILEDEELVFVLADPPDDSGLQIQTAEDGDTFETWAEVIYNDLLKNYLIATYYDLTLEAAGASSRVITFRAKTPGADYSLDFSTEDILVIDKKSENNGVDAVFRDNFVILGSIFNADGDKLFEDEKPVDTTQGQTEAAFVYFDFAEYIESMLLDTDEKFFTFPEPDDTEHAEHAGAVVAFITKFAQKWSGDVRRLESDVIRYAIYGGLSRDILSRYISDESTYFDGTKNLRRFLTWAPLVKKASTTSIEKLYFFFPGDKVLWLGYTLVGKVTYTDGSTSTTEWDKDPVTYNAFSIVEFMVGYEKLASGGDPSKTVSKWEVWLINEDDEVISEVRTFILDRLTYLQERQFIFRNSFGVYDCIRCTGIRDSSLRYERVSGMTILQGDETSFNAPDRQFSAREQQTFLANTGWITRDEKDWLRDLLLSNDVYEIVGDQLIPVRILTDKIQLFKDGETLYFLEFEYTRAWTDRNIALDYDPESASE